MELTPIDLESFTNGRLARNDFETQRLLNAALTKVRSYCHWHVSPVQKDLTLTLDGPGDWGGWGIGAGYTYGGTYYGGGGALRRVRVGGQVLYLPTKRLQSITSVVEDGVSLDVSDLAFDETGNVVKMTHQSWSVNPSSIVVTFTHGWSETEAADWRQLVLMIADRMSMVRGLVGATDVTIGPYRVGAIREPFADLLDQIDVTRYVRMSV